MVDNAVQQILSRFAPMLIFISIALIVCGATVLLYFGYTVYQLIEYPEKSQFFQYILSQLPVPTVDTYTLKITDGGKVSEVVVPTAFMAYGRIVIAFMVWAVLGGVIVSLIRAGTAIFRALTDKPVTSE